MSADRELDILGRLIADLFVTEAVYRRPDEITFALRYRFDPARSRTLLEERLKLSGYAYTVNAEVADLLFLRVNPRRRIRVPLLNVGLFIATLFSVYVVPVFLSTLVRAENFNDQIRLTLDELSRGRGLTFAAAIISILLVHEMGHFFAGRRRGIATSWPYFIPAPNLIGTFGAIIKTKSPFWNRSDLIEVGSGGPLAGWIVALGWLLFGLTRSTIASPETAPNVMLAFSLDGESILMRGLAPLLIGPLPEGHFYVLSEAAFAGWVGLLVTAINLLPIGQLDGGHIVYGVAPRWQRPLAWVATAGLLVLGFQSTLWWVFAAFGLLFGVAHPPTLNDTRPLSPAARALATAALIIMLLSFTPVPFR